MATRRGSNSFHGSAYEYYYASDVGAANNWDANHTPSGNLGYTPLPITHNNRFGAALGGQLIPKNFLGGKWYFFVNYEGFRFPQSSIIQRTVPTPLLDAGVNPDYGGKRPRSLQPESAGGHRGGCDLCSRGLPGRLVRSARAGLEPAGVPTLE